MNDYTVKEVDSDVREFASLLSGTTIKENSILPATLSANLPSKNISLCDGIHLSVCVLVLLFVALWFILRGYLFYAFPCVILFLCFQSLNRLGKRELILVLFVRLFDLCLFGFVGFLFLLVSGKGCGL